MNNKKIKTLCTIALSLVAFSLLFTFALLLFGVYGDSIIKNESTGGSNQDIGQGIALACTISIHLVTVVFALIVKSVALIMGFSSCFSKKKKSVIVTAVFACIIAALSLIISTFAALVYPDIASSNFNAAICYIAFILMPLTDVFWIIVAILRAVYLSKRQKTDTAIAEENNRIEENGKNTTEETNKN